MDPWNFFTTRMYKITTYTLVVDGKTRREEKQKVTYYIITSSLLLLVITEVRNFGGKLGLLGRLQISLFAVLYHFFLRKWWSDAHFVPFLFYYYCKENRDNLFTEVSWKSRFLLDNIISHRSNQGNVLTDVSWKSRFSCDHIYVIIMRHQNSQLFEGGQVWKIIIYSRCRPYSTIWSVF